MSDYIKREDAIDIVKNLKRFSCFGDYGFVEIPMVYFELMKVATADVAPVRHGRWIEHYKSDAPPTLKERWICSWCGNVQTYGATGYCPNCGARMDGEIND